AGAHAIRIQGKCFEASCDRLTLQEAQDTVLLEGNVSIEIHRKNHPARIEAQRVLVNLKKATFDVNPPRPRTLRAVSVQTGEQPVYSAPMPTPVPTRPVPSMRTRPSSTSAVDVNPPVDELLNTGGAA